MHDERIASCVEAVLNAWMRIWKVKISARDGESAHAGVHALLIIKRYNCCWVWITCASQTQNTFQSQSRADWHENMWEFVSVNVNKDSACTWPLQLLLWEQADSCSVRQWSSVIISMLCTFLLGFHAKSVSQLSIAILLGCWISWFVMQDLLALFFKTSCSNF